VINAEKSKQEKININKKVFREKFNINIEEFYLPFLSCMLSCLFARINIAGVINPVSIAFCWAFMGRALFYPLCLFSFLGYISGEPTDIIRYITSITIMVILGFIIERDNYKNTGIKKFIIPVSSIVFGGIVQCVIDGFDKYIILRSIADGLACCGFISIFSFVISKKKNYNNAERNIKNIAVMFIISLFIASLQGIEILGIDIKVLFSVFTVLFLSSTVGTYSSAYGIILGFTLYACSGVNTSFLAVLCISSLICPAFYKGDRLRCVWAFIAVAFVVLLIMGTEGGFIFALSCCMGVILYLVTPQILFENISKLIQPEIFDEEVYIKNAVDIMENKILDFSVIFRSVADAFEPERELFTENLRKKNEAIIDDAAEKVCKDCTMNNFCWGVKSCDTFSGFYSVIGNCRSGNTDNELPENLKEYCIKPKKLYSAINEAFRFINYGAVWKERFIKSRSVISDQLNSVASIIEGMVRNNFTYDIFSVNLADNLKAELKKNGISTGKVYVYKNKNMAFEIEIERGRCPFKNNDCTIAIIPAAEKVCGVKFEKSSVKCSKNKDKCVVKLRQTDRFGFKYGIGADTKSESDISGDSFMAEENSKGILNIAVSDGMGSGKKAKEESLKAIELLKKFSGLGFGALLSTEILNAILVSSSDKEMFATLDVCSIDMYTGKASLIKNGGASAFIIRDGSANGIRSTSLPVGIIGEARADVTEFDLRDGDMILMATDGFIDSIKGTSEEAFVEKVIKNNKRKDINKIAEEMIKEAKSVSEGKIDDDMLVLLVKIFEKH